MPTGLDSALGTTLAQQFVRRTELIQGLVTMKVKFTLTMDNVVVEDKSIDQVILDWVSDVEQTEIMDVSHRWITTQNFLTKRMVGLSRVGESSLTIEPLEEE